MRIAAILIATVLVTGCTPSYTELKAERDLIMEEFPAIRESEKLLAIDPSLTRSLLELHRCENVEQLKAKKEKMEKRLKRIDELMDR